jgi:hypothetical protein
MKVQVFEAAYSLAKFPELANVVKKEITERIVSKGKLEDTPLRPGLVDRFGYYYGDKLPWFEPFLLYNRRPSIDACSYLDMHVDDVDGEYTLGFVLTGDHTLLTIDDTLVELTPGTVFLLHNITKHAALRNETNKENIPLFFINTDFMAKDMGIAVDRVMQSLNHYKAGAVV